MIKLKIPLDQLTRTVTTVDGKKIKLVDVKNQCGEGDCFCVYGFTFSTDPKEREKNIVIMDSCSHHQESKEN